MSIRRSIAFAALLCVSLGFPECVVAGSVDVTPGRKYRVTNEHGPWMIFVASFKKPGVDRPDNLEKGIEDESVARAAAERLVLELRKKGVPAYVFELQKKREEVMTQNRRGERQLRKTLADDAQISVMAGNYTSLNNDVAVKTLEWIKRFHPESFGDLARFRVTPGRQGPLAGAFLTINPLLSQEEVAARTVDEEAIKLLKKLNNDNEFRLSDCKGSYSLLVKEFKGRSGMTSGTHVHKAFNTEDTGWQLGKAGYDAWQLCASLRNRGVDAYLWHEEFRSIVTVGAFASPTDPSVRSYKKQFGASQQRNPSTGIVQTSFKSEPPMVNGVYPSGADQVWLFDADPRVLPVPSLPKSRGLFRLGR